MTDQSSVSHAAEVAGDVDLLVNNAAIAPGDDQSILGGDDDVARQIFETNFFGTLRATRSFAPVLAANGGGAILNILSLAAWIPVPTAYAASKAAMWSATNALRAELAEQGTTVTGLIVGAVDTAMAAHLDMPKVSAPSVVEQGYDGVAIGAFEVLADADSREFKYLLSASSEELNAVAAKKLENI